MLALLAVHSSLHCSLFFAERQPKPIRAQALLLNKSEQQTAAA
jgi:hypothetical protein